MDFHANQKVRVKSSKYTELVGMGGRVIGDSKEGDIIVELPDRGNECVHFSPEELESANVAQSTDAQVTGNASSGSGA